MAEPDATPTEREIREAALDRYETDAEFHARVYTAAQLLDSQPWKIVAAVHAADLAADQIKTRQLRLQAEPVDVTSTVGGPFRQTMPGAITFEQVPQPALPEEGHDG